MPSEYRELTSTGDVRQHATFVKSYIVESHDVDGSKQITDWLKVFSHVHQMRDQELLLLVTAGGESFFADFHDSRFLILHSIAKAEIADRIVEQLTQGDDSAFDRAWLPSAFLLSQKRGRLRGFKFGHNRALSGIDSFDTGDASITVPADESGDLEEGYSSRMNSTPLELLSESHRSKLSITNSATAEADLAAIQSSHIFHGRRALDAIEFVTSADEQDRVVTDAYSSGKVVGSGNSAALHLLVVGRILDSYRKEITNIEDNFRFKWMQTGTSFVKSGEPILIKFPEEMITDLQAFVTSLFSTSKPFRLFGIPHRISDHRVDVEGLDLHTMDPVSFEITRGWMRMYLPEGSCGNIVARLLTNLQHSGHSEILAVAPSSGSIILGEVS